MHCKIAVRRKPKLLPVNICTSKDLTFGLVTKASVVEIIFYIYSKYYMH